MATHKGSARAAWCEDKGAGHSCFENLFGLGICSAHGERKWLEGDMGDSNLQRQGACQKGVHADKRIRFLWTRCARGGRGSRLSSPHHAGV